MRALIEKILRPDYGLSLPQMLREALTSLRLAGQRTVLAVLGVAVACAAVIALLNIGHNTQLEAMKVFEEMGNDLLIASVQLPMTLQGKIAHTSPTLDTLALRRSLPDIQLVTPLMMVNTEARLRGRTFAAMLLASNGDLPKILALQLAQGRFLNDFDKLTTYAVLGAGVAAESAVSGKPVAVGESIQIGGYLFEIAGILQPQERNPFIPVAVNDTVFLPIGSMRRVSPNPQMSSILARSQRSDMLGQTASGLQTYLTANLPSYDINVQIPQQLLDSMARQSRLFSWLLLSLGGIALLVGGVGIMNVMIMKVAERRKEIGLRMALGARPGDIAGLFLLEAIMLAVAGALLGALLGVGGAWWFVHLSTSGSFVLSISSLPLGVGSAALTGLFFGLYPAMNAARLRPVQALRDE